MKNPSDCNLASYLAGGPAKTMGDRASVAQGHTATGSWLIVTIPLGFV